MKRIAAFILLIALAMTVTGMLSVSAEGIRVSSRALEQGAAYNEYSYDLNDVVSGGTAPYTFEFIGGLMPAGLELNKDGIGIISGIPKAQSLYPNINIRITDAEGNYIDETFWIYIQPRKVSFTISDYNHTYEPKPDNPNESVRKYSAAVEYHIEDGGEETAIEYTVTYGTERLSEVENAGRYSINITAMGCEIVNIYDTTYGNTSSLDALLLTVDPCPETSITAFDAEVSYDGSAHPISVTTVPDGLPYSATYVKEDGTVYNSAPSANGTYSVTVRTTHPNYVEATDTATLVISADSIGFEVSENEHYYDSQGHGVKVTPTDAANEGWKEGTDYTVTYQQITTALGENVEELGIMFNNDNKPTDAGTYKINIIPVDENYTSIAVEPNVLTIKRNPIAFEFQYTEGGYAYTDSYTVPLTSAKDYFHGDFTGEYTVKYIGSDGTEYDNDNLPASAGTYTVSVTPNDNNYITGSVSPTEILISPMKISFTVEGTTKDYNESGQGADNITATDSNGADFTNFTVKYTAADGIEYEGGALPVNAGTYTITVSLNDSVNYEIDGDSEFTFTINPISVSFEVEGTTKNYNGDGQGATVSATDSNDANFTDFTVKYTAADGTEYAGGTLPVNAGEYDAVIELNDSTNYKINGNSEFTFTINAVSVSFTVEGTTKNYNGNGQGADITAKDSSGADFTGFTVKYTAADGTEYAGGTLPVKAGEYDAVIELNDSTSYEINGDFEFTFTINPISVSFEIEGTTKDYNGDEQGADITATDSSGADFTNFTVKYTAEDGTEYAGGILPVKAGKYDAVIELSDSTNYEINGDFEFSFVISKKKVFLTIDEASTEAEYDGGPHSLDISVKDEDDKDYTFEYTVIYTKDEVEYENSVTLIGEYTAAISASDNYEVTITNPEFAVMKITSAYVFSIEDGNSPAAKTDAELALYGIGRSRYSNNVHGELYGEDGPSGLDDDPYTVIVKNIDNYTDAGMTVTYAGTEQTVAGSEPVQDIADPCLYKVTYTYDEEIKFTRYIMVVGRIGDANGDSFVSAIDANVIDRYIAANGETAAADITKARVWDLDFDGRITAADADAIRSRYISPLKAYYPWID